jgi:hypothetical protein
MKVKYRKMAACHTGSWNVMLGVQHSLLGKARLAPTVNTVNMVVMICAVFLYSAHV